MSQKLGYILDEVFVQHRAPSGHPERPARAEAVRDALNAAGIAALGERLATRMATDDELVRVHAVSYLDELAQVVPGNTGWLDADTYFSPGTWQAAIAAAGSTTQLALDVLHGRFTRGLAVVRPPGHHATPDRAMGFCLLNNVAVAAAALRAQGAARVAILDWDVHHGNGTQDIFWDDPSVLYVSLHQWPVYPGTGRPGEGNETTVNVALPEGAGNEEYVQAFETIVEPAVRGFEPELLIVSAGFDAHTDDPLAMMELTGLGFRELARRCTGLAPRVCAVLEGGYNLETLPGLVHAALDGFS